MLLPGRDSVALGLDELRAQPDHRRGVHLVRDSVTPSSAIPRSSFVVVQTSTIFRARRAARSRERRYFCPAPRTTPGVLGGRVLELRAGDRLVSPELSSPSSAATLTAESCGTPRAARCYLSAAPGLARRAVHWTRARRPHGRPRGPSAAPSADPVDRAQLVDIAADREVAGLDFTARSSEYFSIASMRPNIPDTSPPARAARRAHPTRPATPVTRARVQDELLGARAAGRLNSTHTVSTSRLGTRSRPRRRGPPRAGERTQAGPRPRPTLRGDQRRRDVAVAQGLAESWCHGSLRLRPGVGFWCRTRGAVPR